LRPLPDAQAIPASSRFGLLVTEEDCSPETLLPACSPVAVMGAVATASRSPLPIGAPAWEFAMQAVADGTERAAIHYGIPAQSVQAKEWGDAIVAWSHSHNLAAVVTAYAPVGPVAERLAQVRRALAGCGVELLQLRRPYDSRAWPHAARGYFRLKLRIPELLSDLGLVGPEKKSRCASG